MGPTHLQIEPLPKRAALLLILQKGAIRQIQIDRIGPLRLSRGLQIWARELRLKPLVREPQGLAIAAALAEWLSRTKHRLLESAVSGENVYHKVGRFSPPGYDIPEHGPHAGLGRGGRWPEHRPGQMSAAKPSQGSARRSDSAPTAGDVAGDGESACLQAEDAAAPGGSCAARPHQQWPKIPERIEALPKTP